MGQFESFSAFLNMSGYGFFVWLSFGVTFAAILLIVVLNWQQAKKLKTEIRQQLARQQRVQNAARQNVSVAE